MKKKEKQHSVIPTSGSLLGSMTCVDRRDRREKKQSSLILLLAQNKKQKTKNKQKTTQKTSTVVRKSSWLREIHPALILLLIQRKEIDDTSWPGTIFF
jgi:hypothetical protein